MNEQPSVTETLNSIIACLDPSHADVAICHLRDAIAAIEAVGAGQATKYALKATIRDGMVSDGGRVTPFR